MYDFEPILAFTIAGKSYVSYMKINPIKGEFEFEYKTENVTPDEAKEIMEKTSQYYMKYPE
jgi:hypothetical protein